MKQKILSLCWGVWYLLCAGLSHITHPTDAQSVALTLVSLVFFVPGFYLLLDARKKNDRKALKRLRILGICSLGLTLALLLANVTSMMASEAVGNALYELLIFVSVPMIVSRHWVLSLFLWACLTIGTFAKNRR